MRPPGIKLVVIAGILLHGILASEASAQRQMEALGRGVVAIPQGDGKVFVGWRLLGTDPDDIAFNVYRSIAGAEPVKVNAEPLKDATHLVDSGATSKEALSYFVRPVQAGQEGEPSARFNLPANAPTRPYLSIPLQTLPGHTPNDASVGDLDGDGEYEIILKQEMRGRDNSQAGTTGETKLEAYKLDGRLLWRINMGKNIREGAHYTQFMVYDLDGDGKAEIVCKTADGTIDGTGRPIGNASADYRNSAGFILDGPEFLTVFEGATGKALATTDYIPARGGNGSAWGDDRGNRVDRFLGAVAYLDGTRPSVIMSRGYYTRTVLAAWNWRDGKLSNVWTFDSDDGTPGNRAYRGQGNHNLRVGDIDGDGKDEIVFGACVIDDDGKGLYSTGLGHGDAIHLSDIDPDRPGLEVFDIHERPRHPNGAEFRDARTGALIWGKPSPDVGRGIAIDIDPRHRGYEMWASGNGLDGVWNVKGEQISDRKPRSCNFGVWWDGDLLREILNSNQITKWNWQDGTETNLVRAENCSSNNSTKSTPCLCADILGDWREEVIWRTTDGKELRIYSTTIPTTHRLATLMHDPIYRLSVAYQNVGYNQPTHTGFYLGDGMAPPPRPSIATKLFQKPSETKAVAAQEPPSEWVESSGHRVVRLSREPGSSSFYFHQNPYTESGDKLMISTRSGLSTIDLQTREIDQVVEGRAGMVVVGKKTRQVFYTRGDTVYATHLDTHATREVAKFPPEIRGGSGFGVNADETLLAGSYVERSQRPDPPAAEKTKAQDPSLGRDSGLGARLAQRLPMRLYTIDIKTGAIKTFHPSTDWLNHVQCSPTDPGLIMFCHEGPWHLVDRIWTIRTDGTGLQKIHTRTMDMEIAGHEFFAPDGKVIWYDLQTPKSQVFWLAGHVLATGETIKYKVKREDWSVHFNVSPDCKLFAGDGGGPNSVAAPGNGQWINLFTPKDGALEAEKLVDLAKHDYRLEPNVTFTPDGRWLVFRSNMHGPTHVYAVEIEKTK